MKQEYAFVEAASEVVHLPEDAKSGIFDARGKLVLPVKEDRKDKSILFANEDLSSSARPERFALYCENYDHQCHTLLGSLWQRVQRRWNIYLYRKLVAERRSRCGLLHRVESASCEADVGRRHLSTLERAGRSRGRRACNRNSAIRNSQHGSGPCYSVLDVLSDNARTRQRCRQRRPAGSHRRVFFYRGARHL